MNFLVAAERFLIVTRSTFHEVVCRPSSRRKWLSSVTIIQSGGSTPEEDLILRRRFEFPLGAAPNDVIAFPNTAGYLMHIVESASHQLPLALNMFREGEAWAQDEIEERVLQA